MGIAQTFQIIKLITFGVFQFDAIGACGSIRRISIWCNKSTQMKRLLDRGWTKKECEARLAAQLSQDEKLSKADLGIINNWSEKTLYRQCREILNSYATKEN